MNRHLILASFAGAALAVSASPTVTSVTATEEQSFGIVTVGYELSEDAVVTFDVLTNGVSVGLDKTRRVWGDVNCKVAAGSRRFKWNPRDGWQDGIDIASCSFAVKAWTLESPPDYMSINLEAPSNICFYASEDALPCELSEGMLKSKWLLMRKIPAKGIRWRMGSPANEGMRTASSEIPHYVTLDHDYYFSVFKVTCAQYKHFSTVPAGNDEIPLVQPYCPVRNTGVAMVRGATANYNWPSDGHAVDPTSFFGKLRAHSGIGDLDLPTDAQWEYACRAGTSGAHHNNKDYTHLSEIAWMDLKTHVQPVGLLLPNDWGLYDMYGNLFELCLDWFSTGDAYCTEGAEVTEPVGPTSGTQRVYRGCSYSHGANYARSAARNGTDPDSPYITLGFRACCRTDFLATSSEEE